MLTLCHTYRFYVSVLCAFLLSLISLSAQESSVLKVSAVETESDAKEYLGGWHFLSVNHDFSKSGIYLTAYFEHDNIKYVDFDCLYARFSAGWKPLDWLKFGVNYVPLYGASRWKHYLEAEVVGTLSSGGLKVSLRERYRHGLNNDLSELRSRLKAAYRVPGSRFTPYIAVEVFTWGTDWRKTRHYLACTYDITEFMEVEWYYMYYLFRSAPAEHVIGVGFNFDF